MVCDEGIAPAMSEEQNATDDPFAVDRKLTAKVNKAHRQVTLISLEAWASQKKIRQDGECA